MVRINLLPWREALRKQQQQNFLIALALSVIVSCILFALVYSYIEDKKDYQLRRNQYLEHEILEVDKQIKQIKTIEAEKEKLRAKIEVIEDLQASRSEIVHLFDELRRIMPSGIYLTSFVQLGDKLTLTGQSTAASEVSALMDAIEASEWLALDGNGLKTIDAREQTDDKKKHSKFIILAKQLRKKDQQKTTDVENENNNEMDNPL
jgi:type IV pilus assembly protein PilN